MKAILCVLIQIPAIWYITYSQVKNGLEGKNWCNLDDVDIEDVINKYYAFLISLFLALKFVGLLNTTSYDGMYECYPFTIPQKLISPWWIFIGLYVNMFCAIFAVWAGFFVIFFSESVFDLILNSVAMFFILEMDDFLVDDEDYKYIVERMNKLFYNNNNEVKLDETGNLYQAAEITTLHSRVRFVSLKIFKIFFYCTVVAGVCLPFYIGVCF